MSETKSDDVSTRRKAADQTWLTGAPAIEVTGLVKRYGPTRAVDDLSFSVAYGRVVGFLGPNGAGKTTTLRALVGLVRPTAGSATVDGYTYAELPEPVSTVGALLSTETAHPGRSGRDHLRVLARAADIPECRVEELLDLVGLRSAASRRAGGYSLGMRQRLGIAAALLGDPQVLVLDEPANGLDPEGIRWLRDLLRSFAAEGRAVLVSSHALAEIAQSADDIVVIRAGHSVFQSPLADMLAGRAHGVIVTGPDAGPLAEVLRAEGAHVVPSGHDAIAVDNRSQEEVLHVLARHRLTVNEISPLASSLEDIYLDLTSNEIGDPA